MNRPDSHDPLVWHEPMPWMQPPPCDYELPGYDTAVRAHRRTIWRNRAQRWFRAGMIGAAGALIGALLTLALTREAGAAAATDLTPPTATAYHLTLMLYQSRSGQMHYHPSVTLDTLDACRRDGEAAMRGYYDMPQRPPGMVPRYACTAVPNDAAE